jgi:hypothetical protein
LKLFLFKVKWCKETGISRDSHSDYVKDFGETFYEQVKRLIDKNQREETTFEKINRKDSEILQEVLHHAYFCNETVENFHGRADILEKVNLIDI